MGKSEIRESIRREIQRRTTDLYGLTYKEVILFTSYLNAEIALVTGSAEDKRDGAKHTSRVAENKIRSLHANEQKKVDQWILEIQHLLGPALPTLFGIEVIDEEKL